MSDEKKWKVNPEALAKHLGKTWAEVAKEFEEEMDELKRKEPNRGKR